MYVGKKKEKFRHWDAVVDILSIVVAMVTIGFALYVFLMISERIKWLPIVFLGAALLNLIEGCKKFYYGKYLSGVLFVLTTIVITAFAVISYLAIWK